ncbi:hypothetical protein EZJ28_14055 [Gramella sp. KN1008]|nr:hypothetical protein EZJ28_14055 [Gramella sp. KN1008]
MKYFSRNSENRRSALYFKAQEIMRISRRISEYLVPDLAVLNDRGTEDTNVYFTGDIIRHSHSLVTNIDKAENEYFQDNRMKYVSSVGQLTERLQHACEQLEYVNSNGREFLQILRRELQKFRKLQRIWKLSL